MSFGKEPFPTLYVESQKEGEVSFLHCIFILSTYYIHRKWFCFELVGFILNRV